MVRVVPLRAAPALRAVSGGAGAAQEGRPLAEGGGTGAPHRGPHQEGGR